MPTFEKTLHFPVLPKSVVVADDPDSLPVVRSTAKGPTAEEQAQAQIQAQEQHQNEVRILLSSVERAIRDSVDQLNRHRESINLEIHQASVEIAIAVAEKIIHERLDESSLEISQIVANLLSQLSAPTSITVRLHPQDLSILRAQMEEAGIEPVFNNQPVTFTGDPLLSRGSCRADSGTSSAVFDVNEQLMEIRQILLRSND